MQKVYVSQKTILENRMTRHLALMERSTGCPDDVAERLLAEWDAMCAAYSGTMGRLLVLYTKFASGRWRAREGDNAER